MGPVYLAMCSFFVESYDMTGHPPLIVLYARPLGWLALKNIYIILCHMYQLNEGFLPPERECGCVCLRDSRSEGDAMIQAQKEA